MKLNIGSKRKLTIANKIYGSFFAAIVFIMLLLCFIFYNLNNLNRSYNELINNNVAVLMNMESIQRNAVQLNSSFSDYLLNKNKDMLKEMDAVSADIVSQAKAAQALIQNEEDIKALDALLGWNNQYMERIAAFNDVEQLKATSYANTRVFPLAKLIRTNAIKLAQKQENVMSEKVLANDREVNQSNISMIIGSILLIAVTLLLGTLLSRNISMPIRRLSGLAVAVASGDLRSTPLHIRNKDEIGSLADSFDSMRSGLQEMIEQVNQAAKQLAASSEEMREGAKQTSAATYYIVESTQLVAASAEEQLQGSEAISTAMEDIVEAIRSIASAVTVISETSEQAILIVDGGHSYMELATQDMSSIDQIVDETANSMENVKESVQHIENIVALIASISGQTRLLALNATIEAARAGEHGLGFAVVAEEVRNLAKQSEEASKKASKLLGTVRSNTMQAVSMMDKGKNEVKKGKRSLIETSSQFQLIRSSVSEVASQIQEIAASSIQISTGSQNIAASTSASAKQANESSALTQSVSAATEEQLAYMEEITASATTLHAAAGDLQSHVSKFRMV